MEAERGSDSGSDSMDECPICMCPLQTTHVVSVETACCKNTLCNDCASRVASMLRGVCPYCRRQAFPNSTPQVSGSSTDDFDPMTLSLYDELGDFDDYFDDIYERRFGYRFRHSQSFDSDLEPYDLSDGEEDGDSRFLTGVAALLRGIPSRRRRRPLKPMQRLCEAYLHGSCRRGARCTFAHGSAALREHNLPSAGGDSSYMDFEATTKRELQQLRVDGAAKEYPSTLTGYERKIVHMLADQFGLRHRSFGVGEDRAIKVWSGVSCPFQCEIDRVRSSLPECRVKVNRVTTTSRKFKGSARSYQEICFELAEPMVSAEPDVEESGKPSPAVARRKRKAERKKQQSKPPKEKSNFMTEEEFFHR
eukprot:TRINITY_DN48827_c0_g1_i1.p1 TRINITY_DN48827_c0_g1~~TRINITY_DN48827_c0_g1_i1.p1  ORF type:complete len:363 (+),score=51.50 TRINITY_DN48827_c0_g1_i1:55-1143(+)